MATCRRWVIGSGLCLGAAVLAATPALALGPASAAVRDQAAASRWHIAYRVPSHAYELGGLSAPGRNDAWAWVDHYRNDRYLSTYYLHWTGHGWKRATIPGSAGFRPDLIASASPGVVWILGTDTAGDEEALTFNGEQWTRNAVPIGGTSLVVLGNDNVWIADSGGCSKSAGGSITCTTRVEHWDGVAWHASTLPVGASVLAAAGHHVWLAGSRISKLSIIRPRGREAVYQWASGRWDRVRAPDRQIVGYLSLAVSPRGRVWLVTKTVGATIPHLDQRTGGIWDKFRLPDLFSGVPHRSQLSYDGRHGFWIGSDHWTGRRWIKTQLPGYETKVDAVSLTAPVPRTSSVWGIAQTVSGDPLSLLAIFGKLP